jgi:hypothetical protein
VWESNGERKKKAEGEEGRKGEGKGTQGVKTKREECQKKQDIKKKSWEIRILFHFIILNIHNNIFQVPRFGIIMVTW